MIIVFKVTALLLIAVFVVFVSDHRRKPAALPLIHPSVILLTKVCYLVPISVWGYAFFKLQDIMTLDWIGLLIAAVGVATTVKAKIDLGKSHTWAGYYLPGAPRVTTGLYRYLRHPMYVGIIAVIVGGYVFALPRFPIWLIGPMTCVNVWIIVFLIVVARRETRLLSADRHQADQQSITTNMRVIPRMGKPRPHSNH